MRRLIVKFKADDATQVTALDAPAVRERVGALNAPALRHRMGRPALELSYFKSITPQAHVVLSSQALSRAEMHTLTQHIAQDPRVEYAEVDERVYPHFLPNDPSYSPQQWNLKDAALEVGSANVPNAWGRLVSGAPVNGAGVVVAVLDTGYRPHADLAANILAGYDMIGADPDASFTTANDGDGRDASALDPGDWNTVSANCDVANSSWHGTRVAGVIAAVGDNNAGIIGLAYGAQILPVRVMGVCGGFLSDVAAAIQWAAGLAVPGVPTNTAHIAKVINLSLGSTGACSATYQTAITGARTAGSVVVVATGNDASTTLTEPANCTGVIAVTAHTRLGDAADYANIGTGTTISAPGGGYGSTITGDGSSIYTTSNTGLTAPLADSYRGGMGTSFSAPHVAGVAALLFQIKPTISPTQVQNYLTTTARAYPTGTYCAGRADCGAGLLDAFKAVNALLVAQSIPNTAPVLTTIPAQTVQATRNLQFTATGTDVDGDGVSFIASGLPAGASFNGASGVFTWNNAQPMGAYTVTIQPTDGVALGASQVVSITVTAAPPAAAAASGGGGGSAGWVDLLGLLALAIAALGVSKPASSHR
jgi:serine protease